LDAGTRVVAPSGCAIVFHLAKKVSICTVTLTWKRVVIAAMFALASGVSNAQTFPSHALKQRFVG
jgi:hypothetical protein